MMRDLPRRLAAIVRWLAPSVVAACLGAVLAGVSEGIWQGFGPIASAASAGFAAMLTIPVLFLGALATRGLWAAWRPRALAPALVDEGGGAPRLAAWVVFLLGATFFLSWACFNGVRLLTRITSFKPNVIAVAVPGIAVTACLVLLAASRPLVDVIAMVARDLDRTIRPKKKLVALVAGIFLYPLLFVGLVVSPLRPLWRTKVPANKPGESVLTPRTILAATIAFVSGLIMFAWFKTIKPWLDDVDAGMLIEPQLAAILVAIAHPLWNRGKPRLRVIGAVATGVATVAVIGVAVWLRAADPSMTLAIWTEPSIGGLAIDTLYDIDDLRGSATVAKYKPVEKPGAKHRDIILVTIDTVRWDHTPMGGGKAMMPTITKLAAGGVVFDRAISPSNVTRRSVPALILGESSPRVRGRVVGWALKLDPRYVPLGERLHVAGYQTAGFFCCGSFWDPDNKTGYSRGIDKVFIDGDGENLADEARKWVMQHYAHPTQQPAFVWIHFIEPHGWMNDKTAADAAKLAGKDAKNRKYDKTLEEVDQDLSGLVTAIDSVPEDRRPILVITSDHGEGLGDHGSPYHSSDLYESQTHVPWLIVGPGLPPHHVTETVSGTDLAPTLLDLAGFVPPQMPDMDGISVADLVTGARQSDPDGGTAYAAMIQDRSTSQSARSVVQGKWVLIDGAKGLELYDIRADPAENNNVADDNPDTVTALKQLLDDHQKIEQTPAF